MNKASLWGGVKHNGRSSQPGGERPFGMKGKATNRKPKKAKRIGELPNRCLSL